MSQRFKVSTQAEVVAPIAHDRPARRRFVPATAVVVCCVLVVALLSHFSLVTDSVRGNFAAVGFMLTWAQDKHPLDTRVACLGDGSRTPVSSPMGSGSGNSSRSRLFDGMLRWVAGDCAGAAAEWSRLVETEPGNLAALYWLGLAEMSLGDLDLAAQAFSKAGAGDRVASRSVSAIDRQDFVEARQWLTVAAKTGTAFAAVDAAARQYYSVGRREDAVVLLRTFAEALPPNTVESWRALGLVERLSGRIAQAVAYYDAGLRIRPEDPDLLYEARTALIDQGDYSRALDIALKEFDVVPDKAQSSTVVASVYVLLKDYDKARVWAMRAAEARPLWWYPHYELGTIACRGGDAAGAIAELDKALALQPNQIDTQIRLAECLYRSGQKERAIDVAEKTISSRGSDSRLIDLYLLLGNWYADQGELDRSRQLYGRGLQIWPQAHWLRARLDQMGAQ